MEEGSHRVNRAQRRQLPRDVRNMLPRARCPDCDSEAEVTQPFPGYYQLNICHDDTCPWFNTYRKARA